MNVREYKDIVLSINSEARLLAQNISTQENQSLLADFITSLSTLTDFVNEDLNLEVLYNYSNKAEADQDTCPLDNLCKNVLQKLTEIEPLLKKEVLDFLSLENNQAGTAVFSRNHYNSQELTELSSKLEDQVFRNLLSAFGILKHLEGHNKTLIVLGPNGSGKTSFANYLKDVESHIKVIPASKPIKTAGYIPSIFDTTLSNYNQEIYSGGDLKEDLLQKLIIGLCREHDDTARQFYDTKTGITETAYEKTKKIFDEFFEVKLDNSAFGDKKMKAKKEGSDPFDFNFMSDGERAAFFYIATVVTAPTQSFIIVDEPENHLNPAIYNKIWDKLITVRGDCQFIFISHTMDFINARSNFELVKIKSFVRPNKFEFEFLGNTLQDIPPAVIVDIVGSRKPLLFCEGSKTDYDYKIYEKLFGNQYTVIPAGNCLSVENSVEACNMHATIYSIQSAIGIIDSDLKSNEEIEHLKEKKVYALRCNEIEMLLLDEAIFKKVLNRLYKPESDFEAFKNAFFTKLDERKEHIVKRLVKTKIDEKLKSSIIDDKNNKTKDTIKDNLSNIFASLNVDTIWSECETKVTNIINHKDYDEGLRYCCLEHNEIILGVGKRFVNEYATVAVGVLGDDKRLADFIKAKYFSEIMA